MLPRYMNDARKDDCIILNKHIYGIVQDMRHYYKKAYEILKNAEFGLGNVDPNLFEKNPKGISIY